MNGLPADLARTRFRRTLALLALFVAISLITRWLSLRVEVFDVLAQSNLTSYMPGNLESVRGRVSTAYLVESTHWDSLMSDLERRRATYIVDTAPAGIYRWNLYPIDNYPRLREYLSAKYDVAADVDGVLIYRRRGCAGPR